MRLTANRSISEFLQLPARLLPDNLWELSPTERQEAVDRAKNLLQIHRNLIELHTDQQRQHGLILQHEAQAEAIIERLDSEPALPAHRRKHLDGRLLVHRSQIVRAEALIEQYQREINLYAALLTRSKREK